MAGALIDSLNRNRDVATGEAQRLASYRDDLGSKYLFGLASFNAASIVAMLAAFGSSAESLASIGIDRSVFKAALLFFMAGVILAGVAIAVTQNHFTVRAGYAAARVTALDTAIMAVEHGKGGEDAFTKSHDDSHNLFLKGLKMSMGAIATQNMSAGAWLGGALTLACGLLGWV